MLELRKVSWAVRSALLVDEVTLSCTSGTLTAVIGPNGAGKSSLIKLAAGIRFPNSGDAEFLRRPLREWKNRDLAKHRAYLGQERHAMFQFSTEEVVLFGRNPFNQGHESVRDREIANEALEEAGAGSLRGRLYETLSGGEKQRVQFARCLAQIWNCDMESPGFLLLDEPSSNLDLAHQHHLLETLRRRCDQHGLAVMIILHDLQLAATYADQIAVMQCGRLVRNGTPTEVFEEDMLRDVFEVDATVIHPPNDPRPRLVIRGRASVALNAAVSD